MRQQPHEPAPEAGRWERHFMRLVLPCQQVQDLYAQAWAWPVSRGGLFDADGDRIRVCVRDGDDLAWFLRIHVRRDEPSPGFAVIWLVEWDLDIVEAKPELSEAISLFLHRHALADAGIA